MTYILTMIICLVLGFVVLWLKERQNKKPKEKGSDMLDLWSEKLIASGGGIDSSIVDVPVNFSYTGAVQTYIVPDGCKKLKVDCVGAKGGTKSILKCLGGRVECILSVKPKDVLYLYVGQCGEIKGGMNTTVKADATFNGGGNVQCKAGSWGGGVSSGGGASDIRTVEATSGSWYDTAHSSWDTDVSLLSRLVVAGGGGGCIGALGVDSDMALGGTNSDINSGGNATANYLFGKGKGYSDNSSIFTSGGGGWYGGNASYTDNSSASTFGQGGSSYTHPDRCSGVVHTQGYSGGTGNGYIILTPIK